MHHKILGLLLILGLISAIPMLSEEVTPISDSLLAAINGPGIAETIPISNVQVHLRVITPTGQEMNVTALEGGMIKIRGDGYYYGIVPIRAEGGETVKLTLYELKVFKPGYEGMTLMEKTEVTAGIKADMGRLEKIQVVVDEVFVPEKIEKADFPKKGQCCLTCGSEVGYACSVSLSCGSCCTPPCCSPPTKTND